MKDLIVTEESKEAIVNDEGKTIDQRREENRQARAQEENRQARAKEEAKALEAGARKANQERRLMIGLLQLMAALLLILGCALARLIHPILTGVSVVIMMGWMACRVAFFLGGRR